MSPATVLGVLIGGRPTAGVLRSIRLVVVAAAVVAGAGCGGSSTVSPPVVSPAAVYRLVHFAPSAAVPVGRPVRISFSIQQPSGQVLTAFRQCCEPHAGVDLIIVRSDDSHLQYDDSDIAANGTVSQPVVFSAPGRYRVVIDTYPKATGASSPLNFQLFSWIRVTGHYRPERLPPYQASQSVDGYLFRIEPHPRLHAIEASSLNIDVLTPDGKKAAFQSWRGALAHALFVHQGSLDYFHTHVCAPGANYCASVLGTVKVSGRLTTPGRLKVGVLLPEPGTWRMFLLIYIDGHHLTVPFTLNVS